MSIIPDQKAILAMSNISVNLWYFSFYGHLLDDSEQEKGVLVNTKWPALGMRGVRGMGLGTWAGAECNGYFSSLHRVAHRMGSGNLQILHMMYHAF